MSQFVKYTKYLTEENVPYYCNSATNETQWERPDDYVSDQEDTTSTDVDVVRSIVEQLSNNQSSDITDVEKLQFYQEFIGSIGEESQWKTAFLEEKFCTVKYIVGFMNCSLTETSAHDTQDAAGQCMAYMCSVCPSIWQAYCSTSEEIIGDDDSAKAVAIITTSLTAVQRVTDLTNQYETAGKLLTVASQSSDAYVGFDQRDIKEFNLEGYDNVNSDRDAAIQKIQEKIEVIETKIRVWLLVLIQLYSFPLTSAVWVIDAGSETEEDAAWKERVGMLIPTYVGDLFISQMVVVECLQVLCNTSVSRLNEECFGMLMKVLCLMHSQWQPDDLTSPKVVALFSQMLVPTGGGESFYLGEGLLHLLNESGYPNHEGYEASASIQLCSDLLLTSSGFFYTNDMHVMVDVALRELANLPMDSDASDASSVNLIAKYSDLLHTYIGIMKKSKNSVIYRLGEVESALGLS